MTESKKYSRIAIVTGASSGIGEATVRKFIQSGYGVLGTARNAIKLHDMEQELGSAFKSVTGDITDDKTIDKLFEKTYTYFGEEASIIVCNAGRGLGGAVSNADLSQFEEVIKLNLTSTLKLLQKSAQYLLANLEKRPFPQYAADILVIGSIVGRHVSPFSAVYGSTKFAVHSLVEGLRREICNKGIRVSLIEPGFVLSGFQSVAGYSEAMMEGVTEKNGPLLCGEDIARTIDFIVGQPAHVHISDVVARPSRQEYP